MKKENLTNDEQLRAELSDNVINLYDLSSSLGGYASFLEGMKTEIDEFFLGQDGETGQKVCSILDRLSALKFFCEKSSELTHETANSLSVIEDYIFRGPNLER